MVNKEDFNGAKKILIEKGLYKEIISKKLNPSPKHSMTATDINKKISDYFRRKGWKKNEKFEYPNGTKFQHDFFKDGVAVEVELSFVNKVFHELVRLYVGCKYRNLDAGVIITNNSKDNIKTSSGKTKKDGGLAAYPEFNKVKEWIKIADLDVPIYLMGIR